MGKEERFNRRAFLRGTAKVAGGIVLGIDALLSLAGCTTKSADLEKTIDLYNKGKHENDYQKLESAANILKKSSDTSAESFYWRGKLTLELGVKELSNLYWENAKTNMLCLLPLDYEKNIFLRKVDALEWKVDKLFNKAKESGFDKEEIIKAYLDSGYLLFEGRYDKVDNLSLNATPKELGKTFVTHLMRVVKEKNEAALHSIYWGNNFYSPREGEKYPYNKTAVGRYFRMLKGNTFALEDYKILMLSSKSSKGYREFLYIPIMSNLKGLRVNIIEFEKNSKKGFFLNK